MCRMRGVPCQHVCTVLGDLGKGQYLHPYFHLSCPAPVSVPYSLFGTFRYLPCLSFLTSAFSLRIYTFTLASAPFLLPPIPPSTLLLTYPFLPSLFQLLTYLCSPSPGSYSGRYTSTYLSFLPCLPFPPHSYFRIHFLSPFLSFPFYISICLLCLPFPLPLHYIHPYYSLPSIFSSLLPFPTRLFPCPFL